MNGAASVHRVLLVEDHEPIAELEREILEASGFQVEEARTGRAALESLEHFKRFAAVALDYRLPDMTGADVVMALGDRIVMLPVIMVTGYPDPKLADQLRNAGVYDFIVKDFDLKFLERLPKVVGAAIEGHREAVDRSRR